MMQSPLLLYSDH